MRARANANTRSNGDAGPTDCHARAAHGNACAAIRDAAAHRDSRSADCDPSASHTHDDLNSTTHPDSAAIRNSGYS